MPCHIDPSDTVIFRYFTELMHFIKEEHTLPSQAAVNILKQYYYLSKQRQGFFLVLYFDVCSKTFKTGTKVQMIHLSQQEFICANLSSILFH